MTDKEAVKKAMSERVWSQERLAKEMGKAQTNVTGYLNRGIKSMRVDVFVEMMEVMGYEVIVRDKMNAKSAEQRIEFGRKHENFNA